MATQTHHPNLKSNPIGSTKKHTTEIQGVDKLIISPLVCGGGGGFEIIEFGCQSNQEGSGCLDHCRTSCGWIFCQGEVGGGDVRE